MEKIWRRYAEFTGRSQRKEYWVFFFANFIITLIVMFLGLLGAISVFLFFRNILPLVFILFFFYNIAIIIPGIAVSIRRLHDTNHSGWW